MKIKTLKDLGWAIVNYKKTKKPTTRQEIEEWVKNHFPTGSGFCTNGCRIDVDRSSIYQLVIYCDWYHMDQWGYDLGTTTHTVIIKPSFKGREYQFYSCDYDEFYDLDQKIVAQLYEHLGYYFDLDTLDWDSLPPEIDRDYWNLPEYSEFQEELYFRFEQSLEELE